MLNSKEIQMVFIDEKNEFTEKQKNDVLKLRNSDKSVQKYRNKMVTIYPNKETN